ncbi:ATP-binding protein [Neisseria musculi]|uniref:ATP-binding protein n=1 Tax=Neisseria TaxID=482 RepID=UPI00107274EE|nr:ATP-binding protein [Neisseria sp. 19428wB4_WF04]TFU40510.1 hypothetical protein E4T99_09095 [Neisseria sp. WF04]TFV00902.1 hypothetical protein E4T85_21570 [Bacillus stratosphericus]
MRKSVWPVSQSGVCETGGVFGDETMTQALIDRLLHRCEPIETDNESFRFQNCC